MIRIGAYRVFVHMAVREAMAFRAQFLGSLCLSGLFLLLSYYLWSAVYGEQEELAGIHIEDMMTYLGRQRPRPRCRHRWNPHHFGGKLRQWIYRDRINPAFVFSAGLFCANHGLSDSVSHPAWIAGFSFGGRSADDPVARTDSGDRFSGLIGPSPCRLFPARIHPRSANPVH